MSEEKALFPYVTLEEAQIAYDNAEPGEPLSDEEVQKIMDFVRREKEKEHGKG